MKMHLIEKGVSYILKGLEIDERDGNFIETPERVARWYAELFGQESGEFASFKEEYTDFILLRGHKMWSLCPHHLLPVELKVSLAYVPGRDVLGLSKLARLLNECNDGPLLQERFTKVALTAINNATNRTCLGAAVLVQGIHGCMRIRGVKSEADLLTYKFEGCFDDKRFGDEQPLDKMNAVRLQDRFLHLAGVFNGRQ